MKPEFWRNKKVLLTGHTGFKGTWLILWLKSMGAEIVGYSLSPPSVPNMFTAVRGDEGIHSIEGDVRDLPNLKKAFGRHKPTIAIHMAAQSLVRASYADPVETYSTNVMGTVHFLEAVRDTGTVKAALVVTSDKCYENREWLWGYREVDKLGGFDPYSNSKACAELVVESYRNSFFSKVEGQDDPAAVATARAGNVIGGGDWSKDRLVPDIMGAFSKAQAAVIRNPDAVRAWQFVMEPLNGYLTLIERMCSGDEDARSAWNFGPEAANVQTVKFVASALASQWGDGADWQTQPLASGHEAHLLNLDSSKAKSTLGWKPLLNLEMTLAATVRWYKAFTRGEEMRSFTMGQIHDYQARLNA